jgi:hypothetical protein
MWTRSRTRTPVELLPDDIAGLRIYGNGGLPMTS